MTRSQTTALWNSPARILIIDDDEVLLGALPYSIQHRLPESKIDTADTPEQALSCVYSNEYDAVICDLCMPRMNGVTLLRKVNAIQPETPVLMITGHADENLRPEAIAAGAYAFLNKPLDSNFIVALLKQAVVQRRLHLLRPACAI
ncbi:response regulator [Candidatus Nitrospira bockiana]